MRKSTRAFTLMCAVSFLIQSARAASDLVTLSPQTWDRYAPAGKEADAIYGDFVLANDQIIAVIGNPRRGRNANMTVREVGGAIIDLTSRDKPNDQLSSFYPGAQLRELRFAGIDVDAPESFEANDREHLFVRAKRVTLRLVATPFRNRPDIEVAYTLEDGWPYVQVTTTFKNRTNANVDADVVDSLRADRTFERSGDGPTSQFWAYDKHFGQAYGVVAEEHTIVVEGSRGVMLRYRDGDGKVAIALKPAESRRLVRRVFPAADRFGLLRVANEIAGKKDHSVGCRVLELGGNPVVDADVSLVHDGKAVVWGRTDASGFVRLTFPDDSAMPIVSAIGYERQPVQLQSALNPITIRVPDAGAVVGQVTDEQGGPIACKIQFTGVDGTPTPDFAVDSGEHAVRNVYYSHDGRFRRVLDPGTYDVIISHGPEYDAAFTKLTIERGKEATLEAKLVRSVKTHGWVSADFHSHSSPSGDNTTSQFGRVLNLLCEHIEFAPCTEHNRLSTYEPHLKRLKAEERMATCVGIELTGSPLPLNHQNAFPLILREHEQDGGGPTADLDPETQIERLALWDNASEKLVQVNHPDIGWMFFDRNGDGAVDSGFSGMAGRMDVIEVHPPHFIFKTPTHLSGGKTYNNTMHNWLQLLNQGRRIPGVVNTDAHYNFHGSGFLRNYLKSSTDDPAEIKTIDMVHAAEQGHLIMTSGPFLEVALRTSDSESSAIPGDTIAAPGGKADLHVRVQCPNWFDVDRVQVFVNGVPVPEFNFTRQENSSRFSSNTIKFDQMIPLELKSDAHIIVATIGEHSKLGPVMGPDHASDPPVAVSNPIYLDVDGGGFKANGDTLGGLPFKGGR